MKRKLLDMALLLFIATVLARSVTGVAWYVFSAWIYVPRSFKPFMNAGIICFGALAAAAGLSLLLDRIQFGRLSSVEKLRS